MNRPPWSSEQIRLWLLTLITTLVACQGATTPATAIPPTDAPLPDPPSTAVLATPVPTAALDTPAPAEAADADVVFVRARLGSDGHWTFTVTVAHPDTGWEDYADGWDVVLPDGTVLKADPDDPFTRLLLHPHENEQPFTRSQGGLSLPDDVTTVRVRAHDLRHGFGGREVLVDLTQPTGSDYEVTR